MELSQKIKTDIENQVKEYFDKFIITKELRLIKKNESKTPFDLKDLIAIGINFSEESNLNISFNSEEERSLINEYYIFVLQSYQTKILKHYMKK